jgi:hypothetical protein
MLINLLSATLLCLNLQDPLLDHAHDSGGLLCIQQREPSPLPIPIPPRVMAGRSSGAPDRPRDQTGHDSLLAAARVAAPIVSQYRPLHVEINVQELSRNVPTGVED